MLYLLSIVFFGLMYWIKGGALGHIGLSSVSGKATSTMGVFLFMAVNFYLQSEEMINILVLSSSFAGAWLVGVSPSMGEEAGAVGRWGHWWGEYKEKGFTRSYGVKKALQRGIFLGAPFAIVSSMMIFIPLGALFPVIHFVGQEMYFRIFKRDSWEIAEPLIGGLCIGIGIGFYLNGGV